MIYLISKLMTFLPLLLISLALALALANSRALVNKVILRRKPQSCLHLQNLEISR